MMSFFIEGGVWMLPIALISALALAVAIERIYAIYFVYKTDSVGLWDKVSKLLQRGSYDDAVRACNAQGKSPLARVLKGGLSMADGGVEGIQAGVEEVTLEVIPEIQKRGSALAGLASLATLLGLLGTVMGLIEAFRVVADAPADQKSILLTKAIAVAMNTTAFGLMVAIPAMLVHLFVSGAAKSILEDIDVYSVKLENLLSRKSALK